MSKPGSLISGAVAAKKAVPGFTRAAALLCVFVPLCLCAVPSLYAQTELGIADDLIILGADGTQADPDMKVKGFTVLGATQSAPALNIPAAPGSIFVNGYVQVSSGMYVAGSSTFTAGLYSTGISSFAAGPGSIYIKDGVAGQVLKKVEGGGMQWADDAGGITGTGIQYRIPMWNSDTVLTNSVMAQSASADGVTLLNSTLTVQGAGGIYANRHMFADNVEISSAPAAQYGGIYVSTHIYVSSNVYVAGSAFTVGGSTLAVSYGNVGVGTITPGSKLEIAGGSVTIKDGRGLWSARQDYAEGVSLSSAPAAQYGGIFVSTHVYASSNVYIGQNGLYVGGGTADQVLRKDAAGYVAWGDDKGGVGGSGLVNRVPIWKSDTILTTSTINQDGGINGTSITLIEGSSLTVTGAQGIYANRHMFADNVEISSAPAAQYGGIYVSTHIYVSSNVYVAGNTFTVGGSTLAVSYGSVGIRTSAPLAALDVVSTGTAQTQFAQIWRDSNGAVISSVSATGMMMTAGLAIYRAAAGVSPSLQSGSDGLAVYLRHIGKTAGGEAQVWGAGLNITDGSGGFEVYDLTNAQSRIYISTHGNVGIGTILPTHKLHVSGGALVTSSMSVSGSGISGSNPVFQVAGSTFVVNYDGYVGVGTEGPAAKLHVMSTATASYSLIASSGTDTGSYHVVVTTTGRVGVGLSAPEARLQVQSYESGKNTLYVSTTSTAGEYSIAVSSTGITNIKNLVIENRASDPPSPVTGQIWLIVP